MADRSIILCPVDFSAHSALALREAAALARATGGSIHVLYAERTELPPYFTPGRMAELDRQIREGQAEAEDDLREFVHKIIGDSAVNVTVEVVERPPVEGILEAASRSGARWIVMGTHGRTGLKRLLMGSVAERIVRESRVPVMVVPYQEG